MTAAVFALGMVAGAALALCLGWVVRRAPTPPPHVGPLDAYLKARQELEERELAMTPEERERVLGKVRRAIDRSRNPAPTPRSPALAAVPAPPPDSGPPEAA